ncbi:MAG: EamA family transporter RarD [Alphaproteobacteria bacterium]|nr:EamA family transporter RarD [Alphaproteobacteria bacterium]
MWRNEFRRLKVNKMVPASKVRFQGFVYALSAALLWGLVPVYIDVVSEYDAMEIVVHRALWSGVLLWLYILARGRLSTAYLLWTDRSMRRGFWLSSALITLNWSLFVYAISEGFVIEAALGYFIYPLVAVVLGIFILNEPLDRSGWLAVGVVVAGVAVKASLASSIPWIGLCLAFTFAFYGITRKKMGADPIVGMFVELVIVSPFAVLYLIWMVYQGVPIFFGGGTFNVFLAVLAGAVTVVPLLLYHAGNRDLPMAMSSLLFYANPTTQLCLGILYFGAVFTMNDAVSFALIWVGIGLYFLTRKAAKPPLATDAA